MGQVAEVATAERSALCDLLGEVGPDAPTLCGEWTTADLAAHLVVRDRDLLGAPGIVLPGPFAALTERRMKAYRDKGYASLVDTIRKGPAPWWRLAPSATNLNEFFVHHEDVRRAGADATPRPRDATRDDALWSMIEQAGSLYARRAPVGLVACTPEGRTHTLRDRTPTVTVTGPPGEIVLFLNGRKLVAQVVFDGAAGDIAALRQANFGV